MTVCMKTLALSAAVSLGACTGIAQEPSHNDQPRPRLAVPRCTVAPKLGADGNDAAWQGAAVIPSLSLSPGTEGNPEPRPTQVKLMWDEQFLFVRFICIDDHLESPGSGRDDDHHRGDVVEVFIDPVGDCRQYIELQVCPENQVLDQLFVLSAEPRFRSDLRFTSEVYPAEVWGIREWNMPGLRTQTSVRRLDDGRYEWITDLAIPAEPLLKRLKAKRFVAGQEMRCNLLRYDWAGQLGTRGRKLISMNWSPVLAGNPHVSPAAMGYITLTGEQEEK